MNGGGRWVWAVGAVAVVTLSLVTWDLVSSRLAETAARQETVRGQLAAAETQTAELEADLADGEAALEVTLETLRAAETTRRVAEGDRVRLAEETAWLRLDLTGITSEADQIGAQRDQGRIDTFLTAVAALDAEEGAALTQFAVDVQGVRLDALIACLGGVRRAADAAASDGAERAVQELQAVAVACRDARDWISSGQVTAAFGFDFADPFILRSGTDYYGYSTNGAGGDVQLIRSTDLTNWSWVGTALTDLPEWAVPNLTWAPSVLAIEGGYALYYSAREVASGRQCISVAVADSPVGPFTDESTEPLVCQRELGGSIDPSPYTASDGTNYLLWKSESELDGGGSTLWVQPLDETGVVLVDSPVRLLDADQAWEDGIIEGPSLVESGGQLYLFYSGSRWDTAGYGVGYATCDGPLGPCQKQPGPWLGTWGSQAGPGGQEFFRGAFGQLYMAYHSWINPSIGYPNQRVLQVRAIEFVDRRPIFG